MKNNNVMQTAVVNQTTDLLSWSEAFDAGVSQVGGKAWNIGRLARYGFNVPAGFVISVNTYQIFLQHNQLEAEVAQITQTVTLENITNSNLTVQLEQLQNRITHSQFSQDFIEIFSDQLNATGLINQALAVRSSATAEDSDNASFAGIHQSFLNIQGIDAVLHAIKCCFASLWSLQAVAYRRKMNINDDQVLAAVIIMQLIDADAAGVAFTCDPVTGRDDCCLISANFGLGESVVNGEVEADNFYVDRNYFREVARQLGKKQYITVCAEQGGTQTIAQENNNQPVLNDEQLQALVLQVSRVFSSLGDGEKHQADVIINNERVFKQATAIGQGKGYRGIAVSAGQIKGTAKIINTPDEGGRLQPGDIMVAPSTDPSWTPLFIHAGGIVLETGGYTSHGSIVAREYGIPAVVNVAGAMSLITENQTISVNGNNGTVVLGESRS